MPTNTATPSIHLPIHTRRLDNGLLVVVQPEPSVAKAALNMMYHVGAKHEDPNRTGFAHLFEHFMFEGSKHILDYDKHVERVGGTNNAFTSNDVTNYYIVLPAAQLETAMWLESDRMLELAFLPERFKTQQSVVIEEFKQNYLNQPYGDAYLQLRPLMYEQHPYRWMTIGKTPDHVADATMDEVRAFYEHFYVPNNATLVVTGGVDVDETFAMAEKWFGGIEAGKTPKPELPKEPRQTEARRKETSGPVPSTQVYKAWHTPPRADKQYGAWEVLGNILGSGKNARLYQALVKDRQLVSSVSAFNWQLHDSGKFSINARLNDGVSVEDYESALNEVLSGLSDITEEELARQQRKITAEERFHSTTVQNRAVSLAMYSVFDTPERYDKELDYLNALTVDDLQTHVSEYLRASNSNTLVYRAG